MNDIDFILRVMDFNEIIDDLAQILEISEEERKYEELSRRIKHYSFAKRDISSAKRKSSRTLIEKFSVWEK